MFDKKKRVYRFGGKTAEGDGQMRELLGGKGANLAEMSKLGMPVPAGFTITTECCAEYYSLGGGYTEELKKEVQDYVKAHTAPYKYPRSVVFKDELPKTVSGKLHRNLL